MLDLPQQLPPQNSMASFEVFLTDFFMGRTHAEFANCFCLFSLVVKSGPIYQVLGHALVSWGQSESGPDARATFAWMSMHFAAALGGREVKGLAGTKRMVTDSTGCQDLPCG